ncbi:hypothetical protein EVAR_102303_1 [Eumeta japonica]|uniref:Uncharacterized protein n=1 Tax=Eumeta variegata TaxID=151549 RepID=A0A4C1WJN3_EUMVA|nr:hypothetical protein EVAR_102303_1 [Eumeta japonica]
MEDALSLFLHRYPQQVVCLVSTVNDSFSPTLKKLQELILDLESNHKTACTLAYTAEEAINVLLILGLHRLWVFGGGWEEARCWDMGTSRRWGVKRDLVLLNIYLFLGAGAVALTFFIYMIVFTTLDLIMSAVILMEIVYHCYFLLLVRSEIVDIKEQRNKIELTKEKQIDGDSEFKDDNTTEKDVEASLESVTLEKRKLDTVIESSDEDSSGDD